MCLQKRLIGLFCKHNLEEIFKNWEGPSGIAVHRRINSSIATDGLDQVQDQSGKAGGDSNSGASKRSALPRKMKLQRNAKKTSAPHTIPQATFAVDLAAELALQLNLQRSSTSPCP